MKLLRKKDDEGNKADEITSATDAALEVVPKDISSQDVTVSGKRFIIIHGVELPKHGGTSSCVAGKLYFLDRMLHKIHTTTGDKVVVVSNWTATLNIIQDILKAKHYPFLRLDGSTPPKERQVLVDRFNRDSKAQRFVFLLSAKAGGTGLNLIG